jgi:multiple sugar transport system substrate-binding protein
VYYSKNTLIFKQKLSVIYMVCVIVFLYYIDILIEGVDYMKRRLLCLVISAMLAGTVLTGCSEKKATTTADPKGNAPKEVTLKVAWWGNQTRTDGTLAVLKMFEQQNPGVKFEPEYYAWNDYWTKMSAEIAGGSAPDIMQQDYAYITQYDSKGLLVDLKPYTTNGKLNVKDVSDSVLSGGMIGNKMVALSLGSNCMATAYDPALFQKAGIPEPTAAWTWEEHNKTVLALHEKLGIFGSGNISFANSGGFKDYLRQNGLRLIGADQKKLGYDDDKYFIDFFGMEVKLFKAGALPGPAQRLEIKTPEQELIVSGKAAMSETNSNQVIAMVAAAKRPLKLISFPNSPNQKANGQFIKPSQFWSVLKDAKDKDMAVKVVDFFTNDIEANKVLKAERGVPISSKVRDALKPTLDDTAKLVFDYVDAVGKVASPIDPPDPAIWGEIQALMDNLQQQMLFGKMTVEEAAKSFRTQANALLAK